MHQAISGRFLQLVRECDLAAIVINWHCCAMSEDNNQIILFVDADACPVKAEIYKVTERHGVKVLLVANSYMMIPRDITHVERIVVPSGLDVADDWIAERARPGSIVITADIPLASRSVNAGAITIAPNGKLHTANNIGNTLATRNLMDSLRSSGQVTGGPAPFSPRDRSSFLSSLEEAITRLKREGFKP